MGRFLRSLSRGGGSDRSGRSASKVRTSRQSEAGTRSTSVPPKKREEEEQQPGAAAAAGGPPSAWPRRAGSLKVKKSELVSAVGTKLEVGLASKAVSAARAD